MEHSSLPANSMVAGRRSVPRLAPCQAFVPCSKRHVYSSKLLQLVTASKDCSNRSFKIFLLETIYIADLFRIIGIVGVVIQVTL